MLMSKIDTEVLAVDPIPPEIARIGRAAGFIRSGDVVVFPTETVDGLGADALQPRAVERIFVAKGRPLSVPLIVHIADERALEELVTDIPVQVHQPVRTFWPGPLTLTLPRRSLVPALVTAGLNTVAIRMPRHPVALALIRAAGLPIAAPSANRFMHISPTTAQHALADLDGRVPLILDGGPCAVGVESTVLDLCSAVPTILRPGGLSLEALRTVLPEVQLSTRHNVVRGNAQTEALAQKAPGQLFTHYAPSVPLILFEGSEEAMRAAILNEIRRRRAEGEYVGVLVADEDVATFNDSGALVRALGSAAAPEQVAAALFAGMRALETAGVQVILCRSFDEHGLGLAVRDRLLRAASGKVFNVGEN